MMGMTNPDLPPGDCLLILGSKVHPNGKPDLMMSERLKKADELLSRENPRMIIVSGGSIDDSTPTEASVMRQHLVRNGREAERIVEEVRSTSTYENLLFSQVHLSESQCQSVDILSHDFHLARVELTAKRLGIPLQRLIATEVENRSDQELFRREYFAYMMYWLAWDWVTK
jgi:uncharacterized SAM-binding protein YcdF (DUF218 family)